MTTTDTTPTPAPAEPDAAALVSALAEALDNALVHHGARMPAEDVRTRSALVAEARAWAERHPDTGAAAPATGAAPSVRDALAVLVAWLDANGLSGTAPGGVGPFAYGSAEYSEVTAARAALAAAPDADSPTQLATRINVVRGALLRVAQHFDDGAGAWATRIREEVDALGHVESALRGTRRPHNVHGRDGLRAPWRLAPWSGLPTRDIVDAEGERVARVPCDAECEPTPAGRAVLAAPDLLAACENARNVLAALAVGDLMHVTPDGAALATLRAAIARAKGGAS